MLDNNKFYLVFPFPLVLSLMLSSGMCIEVGSG